jgi:adenylate cyclase
LITNKHNGLGATIIFCVSAFVLSHLCFFLLPDIFINFDKKVLDQLFLYKINSGTFHSGDDDTIVHINLDNTSIKQLNSQVLDRKHCARMIQNLSAMDVSSQVYDFILPKKMKYQDNSLIVDAVKHTDNVYFGLAFEFDRLDGFDRFDTRKIERQKTEDNLQESEYINETIWHPNVQGNTSGFITGKNPLITFPELAAVSSGLGFINLFSDKDGVFRKVPLLLQCGDGYYPSLPFLAVCKYLSVSPGQITIKPGEEITLKDAVYPGETRKKKDIKIPIDEFGNMIINFSGPWEKMKHYHFIDVLRVETDSDEILLWKNELSGKIAVISEVSTASKDLGPVPMDSGYPLSGIHSNVIHTILSGDFITELNPKKALVMEVLLMALVILVIFNMKSPVTLSLASVSFCIVYFIFSTTLFLLGNTATNIIRPLLMILFSFFGVGLFRFFHEAKEKAVIKRTFETYFPPSVVKKIMGKSDTISTSGKKKEITILFSDIKDFTELSSEMNPDHIKEILNEYFEEMTDIVFKYGGTLDKFIGDGLMVFFGDPENQPDHAMRCVKTAIEMQEKTNMLNAKWKKEKGFPIQIRIGINTGVAVVGNMGSSRRLSYTAIGSNVNLAQRLESAAPVNGILISQHTYSYVEDHISVKPMNKISVKGFTDPIASYEVIL